MNILDKMGITGKGTEGNTIRSDYFYMGSEGFIFENLYIPLDAVSVVKLLRIADKPLKPYLIMAVLGLLMCIGGITGKSFWLVVIAVAIILYGSFGIYITWKYNQVKVYRILLKLNNGESYTLAYGTLDDTVKVVNKIRLCITEKKMAKNYFVNKGNMQCISDNSVGKVCDNVFSGNIGKMLAGMQNSTNG